MQLLLYFMTFKHMASQLPPNLSFEQGSTIPAALVTAVFGFYGSKVPTGELRGAGLTPFWEEGGREKYANQPIVVVGGSSATGQQGQCLWITV